ncbi:MAG TPA: hypothetical protein DIU15_11235 [Deltaproteobacteria bacterium]|nr:hypothetical protein [Deltaproteobacteria bacterium]HCP46611.1 hypothetical protein [Deltaproteobacteria bacterium]|tara:strand:- start:27 stop:809 length:783 start_codon:yes stop_codon:yes gene_type:complete
MTEPRPHPLYLHFRELPLSLRVAYTGTLLVLSVGYIFSMIYVFASHAGRDGQPMFSADDLIIAYSGSKADTRLEAALKGPMAGMLPEGDRAAIVAWVRSGAEETAFNETVSSIFQQRCHACHAPTNPHLPDLTSYDKVMAMVELDTGMDIYTMVRVSHTHLLGITFMFFIMGIIFSHAYLRPVWLKCTIVGLPFATIFCDIVSWYLTKIVASFAYVVIASGALMGISFGTMVVVSLLQMWVLPPPAALADRLGGDGQLIP